ncbi:putative F-box protein At2g16220 isoform X2 [Hordeum vulgare subsp. vulgare]|uniref:F-box domain-containing protein n=1 Tax=Hordeum vulgare subsp. vulgare TaxID=112509 RepID=A0A8I6X6N6_HORVV|nr:putative F-box protein At2g16220 isoform X2 [Hordeum vulgare subsp. vulgare]
MDDGGLRRHLKPSAMEEKCSGRKKKVRTTYPPAEEAAAAAASLLTEDLILEILSRLPARSVHRFKCVSSAWRDLIADPAHRKKLSQPLAGFLYSTYHAPDPRFYHFHFAEVPGGAAQPVDPSLSFLPSDEYWYVDQLDTCNGLLLCRGHKFPSPPSVDGDQQLERHYIVCNPATGAWLGIPALPPAPAGRRVIARLAFDPAVSSHFHVLQFEDTEQDKYITGVTIYSSQTGAWTYRGSRLVEKVSLLSGLTSVFFQGMLHLIGTLYPVNTDYDTVLVAVDMEGQMWKTIRVPSGGLCFDMIGVSQGCLHYAATPLAPDDKKKEKNEDTSAVWYMEDYDSKEWVLKHRLSYDELRGMTGGEFRVAAFHPDCDTIYLDSFDADSLASYDMKLRKFHRIRSLRTDKAAIFLPYVPLFSDSFAGADGQ